jgi:hypothetical protein
MPLLPLGFVIAWHKFATHVMPDRPRAVQSVSEAHCFSDESSIKLQPDKAQVSVSHDHRPGPRAHTNRAEPRDLEV